MDTWACSNEASSTSPCIYISSNTRSFCDMSLRDAGAAAGLSHVHVKKIEDGVTAPSFDKVMFTP